MQISNLTQYLSVKNIFIAIVVLNILSAMSMSRFGGTFHEPAKVTQQAATPRVSDLDMIAHFMPGEAVPQPAEHPAMVPQHRWTKYPAEAKSEPRRPPSKPPSVNWPMLLSLAAMALYARYLATRMAQTAVTHAVDSVKQIVGALADYKTGGRTRTKPAPAADPSTQAPSKAQAAQPRKSTVVRASRWPFAA